MILIKQIGVSPEYGKTKPNCKFPISILSFVFVFSDDEMSPESENKCKVTCELLSKDYRISIKCAHKILRTEGFKYWKSYIGLCDDNEYAVSLLRNCDPKYLSTYDEDL